LESSNLTVLQSKEIKEDMDIIKWHSELSYEEWMALPVSGSRPSARYKHAAVVVGEKLYIVGGSRNGRHLSDVQVFDLRSLVWSNLKLKTELNGEMAEDSGSQEVLPPMSDHSMIKWGNKLLILGGHSKKSSVGMIVWYIDLETNICGVMETSGKVPAARGGHSVTLVGSRVVIFGGEDRSRKLLSDVHVLDLETMTWEAVETTQTPPAPRYDHTAALLGERYLLVFGGCSHSIFFSDLHVLDLETNEWSQPQVQGDLVTPRAGHAGVVIGDDWFIVGGGDNCNGCPETIVLDMSKLAWKVLTSVKERDPLASEGLSVCTAIFDGVKHLIAFGGYNGKYNNEVFILQLRPRDIARPKIFQSPAAAAAAASVTAAYALAKSEKLDFPQSLILNSNGNGNNLSEQDVTVDIDSIKEEKRVLELSLAEARDENSRLREKVDEVNSTHGDLSKELQSVQGQLITERSRCFKLEAQIAELQKMLESLQTIENEVQILRRQKSALEQEMEQAMAVQRQSSGGVWGWIAGSQ
ncbi:acyl-CoA-binding domain-containing protein 4, partial [Mangifera indica]|uniref:acyl-CoA-binding domain-containing protein 4 n=1 Tax=Mangifera indica TaxID=29780 RepID=UPI001CFBEF68